MDKALFARTEDAEVLPADTDDAGEEEGTLTDLASLPGGGGLGADGIPVQEHPSGGWGLHASCNLAAGETVEGRRACPRHLPWTRPRSSLPVPRSGLRWGAGRRPGLSF